MRVLEGLSGVLEIFCQASAEFGGALRFNSQGSH